MHSQGKLMNWGWMQIAVQPALESTFSAASLGLLKINAHIREHAAVVLFTRVLRRVSPDILEKAAVVVNKGSPKPLL